MTMPRRLLSTSKNGHSTVSVGNLYLVILTIKKGITWSSEGTSHVWLCTHCLRPCHHHWKQPSTFPFAPYLLVLIGIDKIPPTFLPTEQKQRRPAFQGVLEKKKKRKTSIIYLFSEATFFDPNIFVPNELQGGFIIAESAASEVSPGTALWLHHLLYVVSAKIRFPLITRLERSLSSPPLLSLPSLLPSFSPPWPWS